MRNLMQDLFVWKTAADAALLAAIGQLDAVAQHDGRHLAMRLMNHVHVVDGIFIGHLCRRPHGYAGVNTPDTPGLAELAEAMLERDRTLEALAAADWPAAPIDFVFTDGRSGQLDAREMLWHVLTHGTYHRGAVGRILAEHGLTPPPDGFARHLHLVEPGRRGG